MIVIGKRPCRAVSVIEVLAGQLDAARGLADQPADGRDFGGPLLHR